MSIAKRMYLLILIVVVGLVGLGGISLYQINRVFTAANYSTINVVPSLIVLDDASTAFMRVRTTLWQFIDQTDNQKRNDAAEKIKGLRQVTLDKLAHYEKEEVSDETDRNLLLEDRKAVLAFFDAVDKISAMIAEGKVEESRQFLFNQKDVIAKSVEVFKAHNAYNLVIAKKAESDANSIVASARWQAVLLAVLVAAAVAAIGLLVTRRLIKSLDYAIYISEKVASGDLTEKIDESSKDEFGLLLHALKTMNDSLLNIVGQVRSGTDTITAASSEIAHGNMELSSRTETQASSLEETAASMEELTSTVKQNADNARQANQLAATASEVAAKGGAVVSEVVETMGAINESSKKIVDIISVIDGIAFQTNILALNAAVEAARAGEQGRGFAVVASEVRNLAQRSAAAAKEIKELIGNSVEKVEMGSKLVDQAGSTMSEVVGSIRRVNDIMAEITAASQEQSLGIAQVNDAIIQMDSVTQQNAALVEEAAAAAGAMQEQAAMLTQVVSIFKMNEAQSGNAGYAARAQPLKTPQVEKKSPPRIATQSTTSTRKISSAATSSTSASSSKSSSASSTAHDGWEEF
ncbi:methyl-accepting chemotaxis protein [Sapientia aquatica]|uniref:HAMP domain-containing protein n=1 Tax=Sapientia aquatica TaxID=1549640 RepID=A0A4R5W4X4_9BURK|nr:methyl-accepting chemotaxis protein [Sapientia aquatica]TDK68108.1 HAMP domain-containing protein [Sapientia aquatica]